MITTKNNVPTNQKNVPTKNKVLKRFSNQNDLTIS